MLILHASAARAARPMREQVDFHGGGGSRRQTHLCELADDTITFVADQLLDVCIAKDGLFGGADIHTAPRRREQLQPPLARQILCDQHPLATFLVVHL